MAAPSGSVVPPCCKCVRYTTRGLGGISSNLQFGLAQQRRRLRNVVRAAACRCDCTHHVLFHSRIAVGCVPGIAFFATQLCTACHCCIRLQCSLAYLWHPKLERAQSWLFVLVVFVCHPGNRPIRSSRTGQCR